MRYSSFIYKWNSRDLRKIIMALLRSWVADNIKRINYAQSYALKDGKNIEKTEEKILLVSSKDENRLNEFLMKSCPQIEKIDIN